MLQKSALILIALVLTSGCGSVGRLKAVGKPPKFSAVEPIEVPEIERSLADSRTAGTAMPPPKAPVAGPASASLFRAGAGGFFRDQRASQRGDIVTIKINIADKADVGNTTTRSRTGSETAGAAALLGLQNVIPKILPGQNDPAKMVGADSSSSNKGSGQTSRSETISMTMAAIVTDVLPNGNLMIRGRQEVRVNFELRELVISGIVRPQDIARDNTIQHSQIAEARISYGGRGQLTDVQQARWGQQIYDALFPF